MSDLTTKQKFDLAVIYVQNSFAQEQYGSSGRQLTNDDKLQFYAYFKQATIGKNTTERPGFFDITGKFKWDAWTKLGDLSQEQAMLQYIAKLTEMAPEWLSFEKLQEHRSKI